jgi:hypothetical protein
VKLKRCSRVIIAAFLLFTVAAFVLDKPGFLFISLSLWVFLIYRYTVFFHTVKKVLSSVQIRRTTDKTLFRQGTSCSVNTHVTIEGQEGMSILYSEQISVGTTIEDGDFKAPIIPVDISDIELSYRLTPLLHGNILLPGGLVNIEDPFFAVEILLSKKSMSGPVLHVQPAPFFEKKRQKNQIGGVETLKLKPQQGYSVRTFRKYLEDDDLRAIDWKMSAKFDTLYVREYTSLENYPPLIIIDLPDKNQEYDEEKFSEVVRGVSATIDKNLKEGSSISLLLISGPNIISSLFEECDLNRFMVIIREQFHPHFRMHHLYRTRPRSEIRDEVKKLRTIDPDEYDEKVAWHLSLLNDRFHHHLLDNGSNSFSIQLSRIFSRIKTDDISIFSLCDGDMSYIREISRQARYLKVSFRVKTPGGRNIFKEKPQCRILRQEFVEGII